jgi:hypothetical protein
MVGQWFSACQGVYAQNQENFSKIPLIYLIPKGIFNPLSCWVLSMRTRHAGLGRRPGCTLWPPGSPEAAGPGWGAPEAGCPRFALPGDLDHEDTGWGIRDGAAGTLDSRAGTLDALFAALDSRSGALDALLSALDSRSGALDSRLAALDGGAGTLDGRSGTLDGRSGTLDKRSGALDGRAGEQKSRSGTLDSRSGRLETRWGTRKSRWDPEKRRRGRGKRRRGGGRKPPTERNQQSLVPQVLREPVQLQVLAPL